MHLLPSLAPATRNRPDHSTDVFAIVIPMKTSKVGPRGPTMHEPDTQGNTDMRMSVNCVYMYMQRDSERKMQRRIT